MGVYAISGVCDGQALIGSSNDLHRRWHNEHLPTLRNNTHYNKPLQRAWNAFGQENFLFVVLEPVPDETKLREREETYIKRQKEKGAAYNVRSDAPVGMRGKKHSQEARQKMSVAKAGANHPSYGGRKIFRFISPAGELVEIRGLRAFCARQSLNAGCMSSVHSGRLEGHKGWRRG